MASGRRRFRFVQKLGLYPFGMRHPEKLEMAIGLCVDFEVGQTVAESLATALKMQTLGGNDA
jgi:hypothetical protein